MVNDDFFTYLQEEIACEIRLMEFAETESEAIAQYLEGLYKELHISDNLRTIPGVGQTYVDMFTTPYIKKNCRHRYDHNNYELYL